MCWLVIGIMFEVFVRDKNIFLRIVIVDKLNRLVFFFLINEENRIYGGNFELFLLLL